MDPVEKLFRDLPNPIKLDALYQQRFLQVIQSFNPSGSRDPDRHFLATLVKDYTSGKIEVLGMLSELGYFAEKAQILDNDSAKSYQLKAFRWIFNGRKDEDYPFNNNIQGRSEQDDDTEKPNSHVFLPAKLTDTQICASCGKTDAKLACSGCLARLDSHAIMKVSYCNKSCQTRHWKEHKPQCLGRKMIWRAASLIRDIFNMFQKKACPKTGVVSIVDKQGFVHLIREDFEDFEERGLQGKPIIYSFPSDLASSEEHALAAVMDSECTQFLIDFHDFLELLILPLCKKLLEVAVIPKNVGRPVCDIKDGKILNGMFSTHTILRATLKSGEDVVIDCTGSQFGWREAVAPWRPWTRYRSTHQLEHEPFGSSVRAEQLLSFGISRFIQISNSQRRDLAKRMQAAAKEEITAAGLGSVKDLYMLPEADFVARKLAILSGVEKALDNGLQQLRESKVGLSYYDARGELQATENKQQAEALEEVWLSDQDIKDAKRKGVEPKLVFQQRCMNNRRRDKFKALKLNMP